MANKEKEDIAASRPESLPSRFSALLREIAHEPGAAAASAWDLALRPGVVIGRFELVREIGRGGFGIVYEARDRELGRAVAFKAVRPGDRADLREERLLREAEAAARLSHPNIVTLFDIGRSEQGPYLVLELLRGQTLARRIEQGPFSVIAALRIAVEIARGVAHAHASGVVHRDLTPANVFLCDDGQVKVLDLGMAHAFGLHRVEGGTPGYMAPEQRRGAPEDERTDVFALGAILYRMLANEVPHDQRAGRTRRPALLDVPGAPALGQFIARMLDDDPVERPRDAGEVLAPLTSFLLELERTPSAPTLPPARKRRPVTQRAAAIAAVVVGVAAAASLVASWMGVRIVRTAASAEPSIAVLPFVDLSPGKDQEYFSDGLADEILNALASVEGLRVPARTSSFFFKGKNARPAEIGKELNVKAVLEGSVRKSGNRIRVTTQLVNVADGYGLWTKTYDRELTDVFAVQDDIARAVVRALDVKLLEGRPVSSRAHATENPEVYSEYLVGREQFHRFSREGFRLAVEAFERAIALDPGYAPAWAGLALPLYYLADDTSDPAAAAAQRRRALGAAEKAGTLSPDLPEALSTRGLLRALVAYDWSGARADLERALAVNAKDAESRQRYGIVLQELGQVPEAIAQVRKAVALDPLGRAWTTLGVLYQAAGQLEDADAAFRRQLEISPESMPAQFGAGRNLLLRSRPNEAGAVFERCSDEDCRLWGKAATEQALGHRSASDAALAELVAKYSHASGFWIAELYAWRGEKEAAFGWLERVATTPGSMDTVLKTDPFLRGLHGDPRFAALLRRLNLPVDR